LAGLSEPELRNTSISRAADDKGVVNICWVQGLAEDLPAVAPGPYRLVTFGQSFHWTDEQHVAETVYDMLEPGGALVLIVHTATGRPRPPDPGVPPIPHDEIKALVAKYLGRGELCPPDQRQRPLSTVVARVRIEGHGTHLLTTKVNHNRIPSGRPDQCGPAACWGVTPSSPLILSGHARTTAT
jgi:hypothetical protein